MDWMNFIAFLHSCMCHVYHPIIRSSDHPIIRCFACLIQVKFQIVASHPCFVANRLLQALSHTRAMQQTANQANGYIITFFNEKIDLQLNLLHALVLLQSLFEMTIIKRARKYTVAHKTNQLTLNFK